MWPFRAAKKRAEPAFRGTPTVRRVKHYASASGHTFRYSYCGWRADGSEAVEHFFECRRDDTAGLTLRVRLLQADIEACAAEIGRDLIHAERYAVAKLALFRALDEIAGPLTTEVIVPTAREMVEFLRQLDRI